MTPEISDFIPDSLVETDKISKLHMGMLSWQNKQDKFKYKCATTTENDSLLRHITCYLNQTCVINYFPLLH